MLYVPCTGQNRLSKTQNKVLCLQVQRGDDALLRHPFDCGKSAAVDQQRRQGYIGLINKLMQECVDEQNEAVARSLLDKQV